MPHPKKRPFQAETAKFQSGADTPRKFLERCLEDVAQWEPQVGAFTFYDFDAARKAADASTERWAAGKPISAIDGMPVGIKDIIDTDDMPTEQGSVLYKGNRPLFGAASSTALRLAGAVTLGKTVTTEFASSQPRGTRNPWDLSRTPGGSSSGSAAAVGAGMVSGAMGTQVVGSIIRPAAFCGTYGYKPSVGGLNRGGSLDLLSQSTSGTIAASLADAWVMAREIVARVGGDPGYVGVTGPMTLPAPERPKRLALFETAGWSILDPSGRESLDRALATLKQAGIEIVTRARMAGTGRGGAGAAGGAAGHHQDQRLGVALAAERVHGAGRQRVEPVGTGPGGDGPGDDAGRVCDGRRAPGGDPGAVCQAGGRLRRAGEA